MSVAKRKRKPSSSESDYSPSEEEDDEPFEADVEMEIITPNTVEKRWITSTWISKEINMNSLKWDISDIEESKEFKTPISRWNTDGQLSLIPSTVRDPMQEDFPKLKSHEIKTFDDMEKRGIIGGIKVPSFIKKEFIRDS